jgi:hypothetical protein
MANCSTDLHALKILYKEKKQCLGWLYQFNLLPAIYIHNTWIADDIYPFFVKLSKSVRGKERLSQWILKKYKLDRTFYYDFSHPLLRLSLLPKEPMSRLILYCGIALNHKHISAVIDKEKKEHITRSIGVAGYHFAVKSVPLLMGKNSPHTKVNLQQVDIKSFFQKCGAAYLLSALAYAPEAVFNRLRLKFPKNIGQSQELFYHNQSIKHRWWFLKRILLHVIDPKWIHLFS